ncbi:S1C family serine protease [Actinomycetospora endophytica]|uniref:S1C family serine protease n=1 Tax=Actinomycetospora endophytica TaxID=2291215 RepID=A0ABS8P1T7_9PSEU|nr:trypsin-like peptidase domain-containing protein [Actinomycetospora endophytica]MCD2192028.1 S1C family serine protease [Actinomycetospora endophytica]
MESAPTTTVAAAPDRHGGGFGIGNGDLGQTSTQSSAAAATTQQQTGVVDIDTVLDYGQGEAAGTGIVLTPAGEILTNNHVVQGSTSIKVTDVRSGASYTAEVVGTDATADVAVLQLQGASGLTPAVLASPAAQAAVAPGTSVTGVGNAGGKGGTPSAATGTVLATGQTVTASDETSADAENLNGMIEVQAAIESGDSGGPLYANGAVIGIDTAASESSSPTVRNAADSTTGTPTTGYAIPIATALNVAGQITSGVHNSAIQQGYPAFLGVEIGSGASGSSSSGGDNAGGYGGGYGSSRYGDGSDGTGSSATSQGAPISGIVSGSPAASAGLAAGDVITAVDGQTITGADQLSSSLGSHAVGDRVSLTWVDADGTSHTGTAVLAAGPAA